MYCERPAAELEAFLRIRDKRCLLESLPYLPDFMVIEDQAEAEPERRVARAIESFIVARGASEWFFGGLMASLKTIF